MSQDGNTYQGLSPDRKLHLFSFEAERFLTSIIGYSKLLSSETQKPPLQNILSADFVQSLDAIQQTSGKLAQLLRDIRTPEENNPYADALIRQALAMLLNESMTPISVMGGYGTLLKLEIQKPDLQAYLPPRFADNLDLMQTAITRLSKTREELANSM